MDHLLNTSVQINDGLHQTSADCVNMAFDKKYGIMFCVYMPGPQGHYGESRGRISLTYFPASQPTNAKTVDVAYGNREYVPNIISIGEGRVRVLYEKNSTMDGDHPICYRDYDVLTDTLSEEQTVILKRGDTTRVPLTESEQFSYLEKNGYCNHEYLHTEQITFGGHTIFDGGDGYLYGAITSYNAEPILYRSEDQLRTVEFFAVVPFTAQYELDYKFLDGKIHAIFRTDREENSICYTVSDDNGRSWSDPVALESSIQCHPRLIVYQGHILLAYNYYNPDTGNRPAIQQGRTAVRLLWGEAANPNDNRCLADIHSKYGVVNICITEILGDLYMAYSTSVLALEYQNGNKMVRGKDAVRYLCLGDLISEGDA